jgi:hypothetical protein
MAGPDAATAGAEDLALAAGMTAAQMPSPAASATSPDMTVYLCLK